MRRRQRIGGTPFTAVIHTDLAATTCLYADVIETLRTPRRDLQA
ncbi:hypothetical protein [Haloplanus salilacus]